MHTVPREPHVFFIAYSVPRLLQPPSQSSLLSSGISLYMPFPQPTRFSLGPTSSKYIILVWPFVFTPKEL